VHTDAAEVRGTYTPNEPTSHVRHADIPLAFVYVPDAHQKQPIIDGLSW
jgi:hypothetical protein